MNCPKCNNENVIKHGKAKGKQRYLCKLCDYNYTVQRRSNVPSAEVKRQALELYICIGISMLKLPLYKTM